jgi:hypothetical protein
MTTGQTPGPGTSRPRCRPPPLRRVEPSRNDDLSAGLFSRSDLRVDTSEPEMNVSTHPGLHVTVPLVYAAESFVARGEGMTLPR